MSQINLPFKVGDTVEVRSFESGFRGAWFLCKITKIYKQGRALFYNVKYLDFPGEGLHKTKVFQKFEGGDNKYLMIRPVYPRQCRENEVLKKEADLEEAVVVPDSWKVGDLVDWWKDHCYWSGTVMEVRENEALKIDLLRPPYGEGDTYDAHSSDLRPSLDWSFEEGWIVPFSEDGQKRRCAKLIKLLNEDQMEVDVPETTEEQMQRPTQNVISDVSETTEEQTQRPTQKVKDDVSGTTEEQMQRPTQKVISDVPETTEEKMQGSKQKLKGDGGGLRLNIMESETTEAAFLDLEELIVRIQWLKRMLKQDKSNSSWKYVDHRPSSSSM